MKKFIASLIVCGFAVAMVACGAKKEETTEPAADTTVVETPVDTTVVDTTVVDTTKVQ